MIILRIRDNAGPGNQMFMYAFAYAMAKKYDQKIWILSEISPWSVRQNILQTLCLDSTIVRRFLRLSGIRQPLLYRIARKLAFDFILKLPGIHWISQPAKESRRILIPEKLKKGRLYVIDGYWECHAYFNAYRADLQRQFRLRKDLSAEPAFQSVFTREVQETYEEIRQCESVAVHIRKGDFKAFGRLMDDAYYLQAVQRLKDRLLKPVFYILSEDEEIKACFSEEADCRILDFRTPDKYMDEWYALRLCKHHIIANSTYSFWAAYLSDDSEKRVVIPGIKRYLAAEAANDASMYLNYYPEVWRRAAAEDPLPFSADADGKLQNDIPMAFVILNYCSPEDTKACTASVQRYAPGCPVIIVDNASLDDSGRQLMEEYRESSDVTVLLNPKNEGYAKGNNVGIHYARTRFPAAFIAVLNPDTAMVQEGFVSKILEEYEHAPFAVLGPMVLDSAGNSTSSPIREGDTDSVRVLKRIYTGKRRAYLKACLGLSSVHFFTGKGTGEEQKERGALSASGRQLNVLLHGCCLIFSPEYFRYFPGFEECSFMYGEESILKMNCRRAGLLMVYQPELRILHKEAKAARHFHGSRKEQILYLKRMTQAAKAIYRKARRERGNNAPGIHG